MDKLFLQEFYETKITLLKVIFLYLKCLENIQLTYLIAGVGFARMESREKCEHIIQTFNGMQLQGAKDPLLVKFADGGSKKKSNYKSTDGNVRSWREVPEGVQVAYDPNMQQNGIGVNVGPHIGVQTYGRYGGPQVGSFTMPGYVPGYIMGAQPLQSVDEQVSL